MKRLAVLTLLILAGSSAQALAAASAAEAARLTAVLQTYFGAEPGVVAVTPDGDAYNARFDLAPLLAKVQQPDFAAQVSPIEMTITDQGGGRWKVDQDQAVSFSLRIKGEADIRSRIGSIKGTGVFDESLGAFASSSADIADFTFDQTITQQGAITQVSYMIGSMHYETALAHAGGGADGTMKMTFTGFTEKISAPPPPGGSMPPMDFTITATGGTQDGTVKGLKPRAMGDLAAWLVAHPSPGAITAGQAVLKDKLRAALPLFQNVAAATTLNDLTIATMMGQAGIAKLDVLISANGVVDDGHLREKFAISGLALPPGLMPPWAAGLVPTDFTIDFNVADFNLDAPARIAIDAMDLTRNPPLKPELEQQLMQALLPKGTVTLTLGPSEILAKIAGLKLEGVMTVGPMGVSGGEATVKLKGIDTIMTAVQAAPPEMGLQQAVPIFIIAKGMARQEADGSLSWKIESTPQGGVLINGVDPAKMGGGQ